MERLTKYSNDIIRNKAVNILRKLDIVNGLGGDELAIISSFSSHDHRQSGRWQKI